MSLEQSMQVSMATLKAATTRHRHTDRVLPPHILTVTSEREGGEGAKALNRHGWHSRQTAPTVFLTQLASKTCKPCKTPYETPPSMVAQRDCLFALALLKLCLNYI